MAYGSRYKYSHFKSTPYHAPRHGAPSKWRRSKVYTKKQLLYNKLSRGKSYYNHPQRTGVGKGTYKNYGHRRIQPNLRAAIHGAGAHRKRFGNWKKWKK